MDENNNATPAEKSKRKTVVLYSILTILRGIVRNRKLKLFTDFVYFRLISLRKQYPLIFGNIVTEKQPASFGVIANFELVPYSFGAYRNVIFSG